MFNQNTAYLYNFHETPKHFELFICDSILDINAIIPVINVDINNKSIVFILRFFCF